MNPNLSVGGSSTEAFGKSGAKPLVGKLTLGFGYNFSHFGKHRSGTEEIVPLFTESIDAHVFNLRARYQIFEMLTGGLDVPIGTLRVLPVGQDAQVISGLGDVSVNFATNLHWIFDVDKKWPSLALETHLLLPTAASKKLDEVPGAPPNLIALGFGALGSRIRLKATQAIAERFEIQARFEWATPWQSNKNGLDFGQVFRLGVGGQAKINDKWFAGLEAVAQHRAHTIEDTVGQIVNSGGVWGTLQGSVIHALSPMLHLGVNGTLPLYYDVNGQQIVQSWGIGLLLGGSFQLKNKVDEHAGHDHSSGSHDHEQDTHDEPSEEINEEGGHEEHGHGAHQHENHGEPKVIDSLPPLANVVDFKRGGESFKLDEAADTGKWVVIDFWAEWCAPCKDIEAALYGKASSHPKLVIKKVEVPTFDSRVAMEHLPKAKGLPVVWILNPEGKVEKTLELATVESVEDELTRLLAGD